MGKKAKEPQGLGARLLALLRASFFYFPEDSAGDSGEEKTGTKKAGVKKKGTKKTDTKTSAPQNRSRSSKKAVDSRFMKDMKMLANETGNLAPFCAFQDSFPTYEAMSLKQRRWYFYWRSQVREGTFPKSDEGYILLYTYELLNGYGWEDAKEGYEKLEALWLAYRSQFPGLDGELVNWLFDFSNLHGLEFSLLDTLEMSNMPGAPAVPLPYQEAVRNLCIDRYSEEQALKLPFPLIACLCEYSLTDSKFYRDGHRELVEQAIPQVVSLVNARLFEKNKRGILAEYGPGRARKQSYYTFEHARHPNAGQRVDVSVKAYTSSQKLCDFMNNLVRYSENVLRRLYGYRGRLRGISLAEELAELVNEFLNREYGPEKKVKTGVEAGKDAGKTAKKLQLDFENIRALRMESDAVRDALQVEDVNAGKGEGKVHAAEAVTAAERKQTGDGNARNR